MGMFADLLDAMVLAVPSQDGRIAGELRHRDGLTVSFRTGGYRQYTERGLESQLSRLLTSLWSEYRRGCDAAMAETLGRPVEKPRESWNAQERRFEAARAETTGEGMSAEKCVFVRTTALSSWDVVVRDGTLARMDETEFVRDLLSAYRLACTDFHAKVAGLRAEHFGGNVI